MSKRYANRPQGSNWGDYGESDQVGRLNLITPERRRAALSEAREGKVFALSLPLDYPGEGLNPPFRKPPRLLSTVGHNLGMAEVFGVEGAIDVGNDDHVVLHLQYSTHWDSLAHIGAPMMPVATV